MNLIWRERTGIDKSHLRHLVAAGCPLTTIGSLLGMILLTWHFSISGVAILSTQLSSTKKTVHQLTK